ncbi:sugar ABC transporter permease [Agromyces rhizosphaerae]|uniref:Sugar ABC transporter permease n=1 Tax=Agromyces rhizosphaerae TaxID=88374 RepID=A0A9W6FRA7_9MICO|nr:carbohydrate ABC transporter permease [Agromyces rhizosphaerae]GLI26928.1 sugar ABC transporter permease [Agromyces rhizosphaerae]
MSRTIEAPSAGLGDAEPTVPPRAPAPATPVGSHRRRNGRVGWFTYLVLGITTFFSLFPLYWMFVVASNDSSAVNRVPPAIVPGTQFLENAAQVFEAVPFWQNLANSFIVSILIAIGQVLLSALAGFAFAKLDFPGRNFLLVLVVGTMTVPLQLAVVPQFMIIDQLGWVNDLRALIVPGLVTAFGVFWMRQAIDNSLPDELIDAARIDGARNLRVFWSIALPSIRPAASVLGLFAFMTAWNDFFWPLIVLNSPSAFTVQVALRQLQSQAYVTDYGVQMAGIVLATVPLLLIFVLLGRQIVGGIMEGALKS